MAVVQAPVPDSVDDPDSTVAYRSYKMVGGAVDSVDSIDP
jgi:hypothetical protein